MIHVVLGIISKNPNTNGMKYLALRWVYYQSPLQLLPSVLAIVCSGLWFQTKKTVCSGLQWLVIAVMAVIAILVAPISFWMSPGEAVTLGGSFKLFFSTTLACVFIPLLWVAVEIAYFARCGRMLVLFMFPLTLRDRGAASKYLILFGILGAVQVPVFYYYKNIGRILNGLPYMTPEMEASVAGLLEAALSAGKN